MTVTQFAETWAAFLENLNGRPLTLEDISDFCSTYATSYEEHTAMYEILSEQVEEEWSDDPELHYLTDEDWDSGFDPYAGCFTYDC